MAAPPPYAELTCQSAFSFLAGASEPETLVAEAVRLGYSALALTDRDGLYGAPRFHVAAKAAGLPTIHGTILTLDERAEARGYDGTPDGADDRVVLLAESEAGWQRLCRLVSAARQRSRSAPSTPLADLLAAADGERCGLLVLAGPHLPDTLVETLHAALGRRRVFLAIHDRLLHRDRRGQARQAERSRHLGLELVVTGGVRFARRRDKPVHDVLTCVRHKRTLEQAGTRLLPNAEFCLRPRERIARLFRHVPAALARTVELAGRCRWSLDHLAYRFPTFPVPPEETTFSVLHALVQAGARRRYRPMTPAVARQLATELDVIERLDLAGYFLVVADIVRFCEEQAILCQGRGSAANSAVCYALGITAVDPVGMELLFERFLSEQRGELPDIDLDIAHQDRERVLRYVYERYGRDHAALAAEVVTWRARSAVRDAGKALGFSLEEVDALAKGIDRRFDGDRDGLPEGWGEHVADPRLPHLLRLAGALQGLPRHLSIHVGGMVITGPPLTDAMPVEPAAMPGRTVVPWDKDDLAALGIIKIDLLGLGMLTVLDRCLRSVNAERRARWSTAAGGCGAAAVGTGPEGEAEAAVEAVAGPEADADTVAGAEPDAEPDAETETEVEPDAESNTGAEPEIDTAHSVPLALHNVPADDPATWDMLCAADTVGVFQVESRAQMNCLPRLRPRSFYDLVVEVALIRPGPIQGDMVHPYLRRRAGRERVDYPHPRLEPILRRTLGVPLFQEQGMKIAVAAAGFSPGEADELRRAMGHKRSRERMAALSERLVAGMAGNGIDRTAAERILQQLSAFADYGFPESHAASFARLVWVSAWLKCHWPAHFLCALLNAQPMGFYAPAVLVSDARRHGVRVLPVDVLHSDWESVLVPAPSSADPPGPRTPVGPALAGAPTGPPGSGPSAPLPHGGTSTPAVRLGLCTVRGLGAHHAQGVRSALAGVTRHGPFSSPEDFARRAGVGRAVLENLARLGALRGFERRRRAALWRVAALARQVPGPLAAPLGPEAPLSLPALSAAECVREDYRMGGITVDHHPVGLARSRLDAAGVLPARALTADGATAPRTGAHVRVAGMVICRQRPPTAGGLTFVTLEDETGFANLIVTPDVAEREREGLRAGLLLASGRVERADGVTNLRATRLQPLAEAVAGLRTHDYR